MSSGIYKKLARSREVCQGAGFLLMKLEAMYGDDFSHGMSIQVKRAIHDCHQQAQALMAHEADNAKQAEAMHEKRAAAIAGESQR